MPDLTDLNTVRQAIPRLASLADGEVSRLISEASDIINTWLGRLFGVSTYTETYDLDGSGRLFLRQTPVVSITTFTVGLPDNPQVVPSLAFDPLTGEVRPGISGGWFPTSPFPFEGGWLGYGFQTCQVVYVAGIAVPALVAGRCIAVVNRAATANANDPLVTAKTFGNVSFTQDRAATWAVLTDEDRKVLSPYRKWVL